MQVGQACYHGEIIKNMLDFENLDHGITLMDTGYVRPRMTASYLMEHDGGVAVIETGVNANVAGITELIEKRGYARQQVEYIIPTHVHLDHAGGVGRLMQFYDDAKLVIHPYGARHMIDPGKLIAGTMAVYGEVYFRELYGELIPVDAGRVIEAGDGFRLDLRGRELLFIDTPGHARHHFCVVDEMSQGIFTGDTFGISYREFDTAGATTGFPTTTPVQFDPVALHQSIDRLLGYQPQQMYLTHYGCLTRVTAVAEQLHKDIDRFVDMAEAIDSDHVDEIEALMEQNLKHYLAQRVMQNNRQLSRDEASALVAKDARLNAQGLAFWKLHRK